ncbi:hypothetical protein [Polaribacter sp. IC073]|uniref:hypothetical protein n=1 Tax=Polaribacter sp. IC073 TaxID=2508540 RepID=UPI0011BD6BDF|nr:hypothetical protein [Polaribacter sp. IC073]TXD45872.1 hypothetical protein ES045_15725 [Polaribacter sp. IC073]
MKNTISSRELSKIVTTDLITVYSGYSSISIDAKELKIDASLDFVSQKFECLIWLDENEEELELTETQKDFVYNLLINAESQESEFDYDNNFHALSLTY